MGAARGPEIIGWVESSGGPEMQQRCTQWSTEAGFIHRAPPASTGEGAPQQRAGGSHPLEEKARAPGVELMFGCGARIIPQRLRRWERSTAAGGVLSLRRSQAEAKVRPPWQRRGQLAAGRCRARGSTETAGPGLMQQGQWAGDTSDPSVGQGRHVWVGQVTPRRRASHKARRQRGVGRVWSLARLPQTSWRARAGRLVPPGTCYYRRWQGQTARAAGLACACLVAVAEEQV